jgi:S1-C subfamily serine protease
MKRTFSLVFPVLVAVVAAGCAMTGVQRKASNGRAAFASLQSAVVEASEAVKDSIVLVTLSGPKISDSRNMIFSGGSLRPAEGGSKTMTGIILSTNGYVVVPEAVNPNDVTRLETWIGDTEYSARIVKSDSQLGMTILKLDVDEPVKPLDIRKVADLRAGEWCVGLNPSGEDNDFEQLVSLSLCRGQTAGRYREFLLDSGDISQGAPVVGLSGRVIGISQRRGRVVSMRDLRDDLSALLNEATGVKSADEDAKQKGWFGGLIETINKEYARKYDLSKSCLWVNYVIKGSPAEAAGLMAGDLITGVNGAEMRLGGSRAREYFMKVLHPKVGQPFTIKVLRDGKALEVRGTFAKTPEKETVNATDLGVTVQNIEDGDVVAKNLSTSRGVLVTDVMRGSAASVGSNMRNNLLNGGDIITALGGTPTPDLATFSNVLEKLRRDRANILLVNYLRGRATGFAALNLTIGENGNEGGSRK